MSDVLNQLIELDTTAIKRHVADVSLSGTIAQVTRLTLNKGQTAWASKGSLMGYSQGIDWSLKMPGGVGKAVGRMMSGETASLVYVTAKEDNQEVVIAANQPGKLATWDLSKGPVVCTQGAFVSAVGDVDISVTMAKSAGAMFFGGGGLFLQRIAGTGVVFIHGAGDFVEHSLAAGEKFLVSTGNLACFSGDVSYGIRGVGGCGKSIFGGEGMFMTELTGPGWVMMQTLKKLPVQGRR